MTDFLRCVYSHRVGDSGSARPTMMLAGVEIEDRSVLHLAELLRTLELKHVAERLEDACDNHATELALETPERHALMHALLEDDSGEPDLGALRATLLQQQTWRQRHGL